MTTHSQPGAADPLANFGNLSATMAGLTAALKLAPVSSFEVAEQVLEQLTHETGLGSVEVVSLQFGRAVLRADPQTVALLRYDTERIRAALNAELPTPVRHVHLTTRTATHP